MVRSDVRTARGAPRAAAALAGTLMILGAAGPARAQAPGLPPAGTERLTSERLTLDRAMTLAVERNERALAARTRVEAAEARVARARAFFFPDLTLSGTYTRRARETVRNVGGEDVVIQSQNALSTTAQVGMTIFDARSLPLYRQARLDRDAARLEARDEQRLIAFEAASAYVATLGLEQVMAAAERRRELAQQTAADARGRVAAQMASSNDLTRAELELAVAERELTRARAELATAYITLGFLIDAQVAGPLVPPDALLAAAQAGEPIAAQADQLVASAQARRLDLAASRKRTEALEAFAREPRARMIPSLGLLGQYRATNEAGFSGNNADWFVGLTLTWLVWDGGERAADRRERVANAESASLEVRAAERRLTTDVRAALVALDRARAAVQQSETVVAAAEKNAQESTILYREGLARALEVADASARLFDAEVALARERYGLVLALLDLRAVLGQDPLGQEISP